MRLISVGFWNKKAETIEDGPETSPAQSLDRIFKLDESVVSLTKKAIGSLNQTCLARTSFFTKVVASALEFLDTKPVGESIARVEEDAEQAGAFEP